MCSIVHADMKDLSESELSEVTGEGIGLVYENFQYEMRSEVMGGDTGNDFKITGIVDGESTPNPVDVTIGQYYLAGTGTNLGTDLAGKTVNIGRLNNPITIDLLDGNTLGGGAFTNNSVLQIAMPTKYQEDITGPGLNAEGYHCTDASAAKGSGLCASRPNDGTFRGERFDMGYKINRIFDPLSTSSDVNLNFHAVSANMDGSYVRLWGSDAADTGVSHAINMEIQMNFYASELVFNSCGLAGSACGEQVGFSGFSMELALGDAKFGQPFTMSVTDTGFLKYSIAALQAPGGTRDTAWYTDYYTNGRKTNIHIDDITVGPAGAPVSFGSASLQGLQIQMLEVTSREL